MIILHKPQQQFLLTTKISHFRNTLSQTIEYNILWLVYFYVNKNF